MPVRLKRQRRDDGAGNEAWKPNVIEPRPRSLREMVEVNHLVARGASTLVGLGLPGVT